jgi:hypothetical protein
MLWGFDRVVKLAIFFCILILVTKVDIKLQCRNIYDITLIIIVPANGLIYFGHIFSPQGRPRDGGF